MAEKIMLIRHAEKPSEDGLVRGVDPSGNEDPHALSVLGWQRAGALVHFFAPRPGGDPRVVRPDALFATAITHDSPSRRPAQTLEPLASFLDLALDTSHGRHEVEALIGAMEAVRGAVLISWTHRTINRIAAHLLGRAAAPPQWPDARFDVVWVFDRAGVGWTFAQVPELLLAGDEAEGI